MRRRRQVGGAVGGEEDDRLRHDDAEVRDEAAEERHDGEGRQRRARPESSARRRRRAPSRCSTIAVSRRYPAMRANAVEAESTNGPLRSGGHALRRPLPGAVAVEQQEEGQEPSEDQDGEERCGGCRNVRDAVEEPLVRGRGRVGQGRGGVRRHARVDRGLRGSPHPRRSRPRRCRRGPGGTPGSMITRTSTTPPTTPRVTPSAARIFDQPRSRSRITVGVNAAATITAMTTEAVTALREQWPRRATTAASATLTQHPPAQRREVREPVRHHAGRGREIGPTAMCPGRPRSRLPARMPCRRTRSFPIREGDRRQPAPSGGLPPNGVRFGLRVVPSG